MASPTIPGVNFSWRSLSANLATFVAPGLVLLLLAIQVAFGLRGFDRPDESLLYVLEVPGVLLGWGGVALLLPLLAWMVLDWWGYDLNGFALKGLGSAVLGIAVGGLVGLSGGVPAGGIVGAGLAAVLTATVGIAVAWILLVLMAIPACVLALSLQRTARPVTKPAAASPGLKSPDTKSQATKPPAVKPPTVKPPTVKAPAVKAPAAKSPARKSPSQKPAAEKAPPKNPGTSRGRLGRKRKPLEEDKAWYPQAHFDTDGNELPMNFGRHRDVGGIRFADEGEAKPEPEAPPKPPEPPKPLSDVLIGEERLPTIPELLAGNFHGSLPGVTASGPGRVDPSGGPREASDATPDDGPIHVDGRGRPVAPEAPAAQAPEAVTSKAAAAKAVVSKAAASKAVTSELGSAEPTPAAPKPLALPFLRSKPRGAPAEEALLPGVRYVDETPPDEEETEGKAMAEAPVPTEVQLSQAVREAVRGPPQPASDGVSAASARAIRKTLRESVAALQNDGVSERHLAKLEALGMFDPSPDPKAEALSERSKSKGGSNKTPPPNPGNSATATATKTKAPARKTARKKTKKPAARKAAARKAASKTAVSKTVVSKKAPTMPPAPKGPKASRKNSPPKASARSNPSRRAAARRKLMIEGLRIERLDPLFRRSVEVTLDRGAASPMLLTRRLGLPFARALGLVERMLVTGVLAERTEAGSHPLAITREEWDELA